MLDSYGKQVDKKLLYSSYATVKKKGGGDNFKNMLSPATGVIREVDEHDLWKLRMDRGDDK